MARPFFNVLTNQYLNLLNNLKGLRVFRYLIIKYDHQFES